MQVSQPLIAKVFPTAQVELNWRKTVTELPKSPFRVFDYWLYDRKKALVFYFFKKKSY